jgi:hypothetical protein
MKYCAVVLFALVLALSPAAKADTTAGPLTFGSGVPPSTDIEFYSGSNVVTLTFAPLDVNAVGTSANGGSSYAFTFDIAPGWTVSSISLGGSIDSTPEAPPSTPWGFEYLQELTLCSTLDVCSSASQSLTRGTASMTPLTLSGTAGAGQGIYQFAFNAVNADAASDANPEAVLFLDPAHSPEPASWLLLGTGLLAMAMVVYRREPAR